MFIEIFMDQCIKKIVVNKHTKQLKDYHGINLLIKKKSNKFH